MELVTVGREKYPGYQVKMYYNTTENLCSDAGLGERYKIVLIKEGNGFLKVGNFRSIIIPPMLCCLNEIETLKFESQSQIELISLFFHPSVINSKLEFDNMFDEIDTLTSSDSQDRWYLRPFYIRDTSTKSTVNLDTSVSKHVEDLINQISHTLNFQPDESWPCRSRCLLIELMNLLCKIFDRCKSNQNNLSTDSSEESDPIVMFLHLNYQNKIKINDLVKEFHTNKTTLNKHFKKITGLTVISYLNKLRINISCTMLRNTNLSIIEIIYLVGFTDEAHFNRTFWKYAGCKPSEYRKNNQ
ncbi:MAG: AraC family transcriptional regulator [Bacillota bacterium]|nr:AraC family transcriptional regulator [Bacillota bacterium]